MATGDAHAITHGMDLHVTQQAGSLDALGFISALHAHNLQTNEFNYNGQVISQNMVSEVDVRWRLNCSMDISTLPPAEDIFQHPVSLLPDGKDFDAFCDDVSDRLYNGKSLTKLQKDALDIFIKGEQHLGLFSPVGSGKSAVFLSGALASADRGQVCLLVSPLRSVALNARLSAQNAGIGAIVYDGSTKASILSAFQDHTGTEDARLPFSLLIFTYEAWVRDATLMSIFRLGQEKRIFSRVVFDEW